MRRSISHAQKGIPPGWLRRALAAALLVAAPPLPIAMRVIDAPFYAAGLILRYGVYYVLVAPFEVLGRTLDYGVEGGVEADPNGASR
jgi:hypothetical protein